MKNLNFVACIAALLIVISCQENEAPEEAFELGRPFLTIQGTPLPIATENFPDSRKTSFTVVAENSFSPVETRSFIVVANQQELNQIWSEIHVHTHPVPSAPEVDFSTEMAIFIFSGQKTSLGYSLDVEQVWKEDGKLVVGIRESMPGPNDIVAAVMTNPYIGIKLEKSDLPVWVKFIK